MPVDTHHVSREPPIDRAQRRREMTWFFGALIAVGALLFGARWWATLLDHVDPVMATATLAAVSAALLASGRRRGLGWNVVRVLCAIAIAIMLAMVALVAVCLPSACFN